MSLMFLIVAINTHNNATTMITDRDIKEAYGLPSPYSTYKSESVLQSYATWKITNLEICSAPEVGFATIQRKFRNPSILSLWIYTLTYVRARMHSATFHNHSSYKHE